MLPEFEPVTENWSRKSRHQNNEGWVSAWIKRDGQPGAACEDSEKAESRQDVRTAKAKPANELRADQRKEIAGYGVCVIAVNFEEWFDVREAFAADDRQRNIER